MSIKVCPFCLTVPVNISTDCIGEDCINFYWKGGGPVVDEKFTMKMGACNFFDRWTGHAENIVEKVVDG